MQNNLNLLRDTPFRRPVTVDKRLQEALVRRDRYLESHPHLRVYQAELDEVLDKSGSVHGRLAVLGTLMQGKLLELQKEFCKLSRILQ